MHRTDRTIAKVGIVVSVLLLGLRAVASQALLVVIPLAAGTGSVLYLFVQSRTTSRTVAWRDRATAVGMPALPGVVAGYLPAVVLAGLAGYVLAIQHVGARTDAIYLLTGAIGVVIFIQVLFVDDEQIAPGVVLFEIVAAALVLRLATLYVTPGYVGVDIWTHATVFVDGIAQTGSLGPLAESKYLMAPIYHIVGAIGALVFESTRAGIYLTLGVVVPLSVLFVYATGRLLVPARWALVATALVAFSDQFIRWGMHVIPTSLGLVFFLVAVYAMTRLLYADAERWVIGLLLVASLAVVFTHQVSTAIVLILLGIAAVVAAGTTLLGQGKTPSGGLRKTLALGGVFVVTLLSTALSWSVTPFAGGSRFLWRELDEIRIAIAEAGFLNLASERAAAETVGGPIGSGFVASFVPYVELFGFGLLLVATVVGSLYLLRREGAPDLTATHVLTGVGLFVIAFGLSLFGVRALLPGRWLAFLYVSMALLGAVGLYSLAGSGSRRVVLAVFLLVAIGYPTSMAVAEKATLENPAFDDQHKRFAYTDAEIAGVETIRELHPPAAGATLATDHPYVSLFRRYGGYEYDASIAGLGTEGPDATGATVYRRYQSSGPVTFDRSAVSPVTSLPANVEAAVCPPGWSTGYANDDVTLCTPTDSEGGS